MLHAGHALILSYRELIARPGKFIPGYESDDVKSLFSLYPTWEWNLALGEEELMLLAEEKNIRIRQIDKANPIQTYAISNLRRGSRSAKRHYNLKCC